MLIVIHAGTLPGMCDVYRLPTLAQGRVPEVDKARSIPTLGTEAVHKEASYCTWPSTHPMPGVYCTVHCMTALLNHLAPWPCTAGSWCCTTAALRGTLLLLVDALDSPLPLRNTTLSPPPPCLSTLMSMHRLLH